MGFVFFYQEDKVLNYLLQGLQIEIPNKTATSSFLSSSRPVSGAHELEIKLSTVAPGEVIWARPAPAVERRGRAVGGGGCRADTGGNGGEGDGGGQNQGLLALGLE